MVTVVSSGTICRLFFALFVVVAFLPGLTPLRKLTHGTEPLMHSTRPPAPPLKKAGIMNTSNNIITDGKKIPVGGGSGEWREKAGEKEGGGGDMAKNNDTAC